MMMILVLVPLLAACGPRTEAQVEEPGQGAPEEAAAPDAGPAAPAPEEEAPAAEPAPAAEEGVAGSASKQEVKPMAVKDFDVTADASFTPTIDPDKKEAAMEKIGIALGGITGCYKKILEKNETLEGEITATVKIAPAGTAKVEIGENTTGSDELGQCVQKELKKLKFPKKLASGVVTASIPITFLPYK